MAIIFLMNSITSISVSRETLKRFKTYGHYGESANDILIRLMDLADIKGGKTEIKRK